MQPNETNKNLLYLISSFTHHFNIAFTKMLVANQIPVTPEQFAILLTLHRHAGLGQIELSQKLERDKGTVTRGLSRLKRDKYVKHTADKDDGRAYKVFITDKGAKVVEASLV